MNYYLNNADEYIKPLRDRGIKVLLSILPNDNGVGAGNLFEAGSGNNGWTPEREAQYGPYPFRPEVVYPEIDELAQLMRDCYIDGIAYDEEYIGKWRPPNATSGITIAIDNKNLLRLAYELEQALGRELLVEIYEPNGTTAPATTTFIDRKGDEVTLKREDVLDYGYFSTYGGIRTAGSLYGIPNDRYGPFPVSLAADRTQDPRPNFSGTSGIEARAKACLYGEFGVVMYYCIRSRDELLNGIEKWRLPSWPVNMFGAGNAGRPEAYLSKVSRVIYGQDVIYAGWPDFPRRWEFQ